MTLYSLDGRHEEDGGVVTPETEMFHGFPVVGKRDIASGDERAMLMAALDDGMRNAGPMAKCFWPRHALQVIEGGKTVDYVICFECSQMMVQWDGSSKTVAIDSGPAKVFDKALTDGGVPLAPK